MHFYNSAFRLTFLAIQTERERMKREKEVGEWLIFSISFSPNVQQIFLGIIEQNFGVVKFKPLSRGKVRVFKCRVKESNDFGVELTTFVGGRISSEQCSEVYQT